LKLIVGLGILGWKVATSASITPAMHKVKNGGQECPPTRALTAL
jgi:hypothetical protein